jgi:toxin ParE1/3/4
MALEIVWTEPALAALEAIIEYLAEKNPAAAERVGDSIVNHVEVLRTFPRIGPRYPKDPRGVIREVMCGRYRIFYRIDDGLARVEILTVWHGSRQEPDFPEITDPSE